MQDIVEDAIENAAEEQEIREGSDDDDASGDEFGSPRIVIVGAGGAGNNTVNRLYNMGISGAETVAINTDKQHLKMVEADTKILVGKNLTEGLGAGGDPEMGQRATKNAAGTLKEVLGDPDLVFVTAGMGGGTGTGAAPVVAEMASDLGAIVVGMVSTPFDVERARKDNAEEGLNNLRGQADSVIVLDNNRLLDYVPNLPIGKAFSVMDQIIAETVKGISETITQPSLINLDYADMSTIMSDGDVAVMLVGETQDKNKVDEVVDDALSHPLLDVDYAGATGGLVHITGGPNLSLKEAEGIANQLTHKLGDAANLIWGARIDEEYKGKVRVMAIMTGVQSSQVLGDDTGEPLSDPAPAAERKRQAEANKNGNGGHQRQESHTPARGQSPGRARHTGRRNSRNGSRGRGRRGQGADGADGEAHEQSDDDANVRVGSAKTDGGKDDGGLKSKFGLDRI